MILWQIYSGNHIPNFINIILQKHFGLFFPDTVYIVGVQHCCIASTLVSK